MNVCVRSLGQCVRVETASGAGAGQRSRHRCPGGREERPRAPDEATGYRTLEHNLRVRLRFVCAQVLWIDEGDVLCDTRSVAAYEED